MATYNANPGDEVFATPGDIINLPDPEETANRNGWKVTVSGDVYGLTPIKINATGTALIQDAFIGATPVSTVDLVYVGGTIVFTWAATRNHWKILTAWNGGDQFATIFGVPDNGPGSGTIVGWDDEIHTSIFDAVAAPNPATGVITIPYTALYQVTPYVQGDQPNSNKELQIFLSIERSLSGDLDNDNFQVATDKTPRTRTLGRPRRLLGQSGETWSLAIRSEGGSAGSLTWADCSFEVALKTTPGAAS